MALIVVTSGLTRFANPGGNAVGEEHCLLDWVPLLSILELGRVRNPGGKAVGEAVVLPRSWCERKFSFRSASSGIHHPELSVYCALSLRPFWF